MGGTSSTTYRRATLADAPSLNRIAIAAYEGYVERLGKPPAPRVGSGLLALAERCAVSLGTKELRLYTNEAMSENLAFYRRHWYVETHRAISGGYRRVFFAKKLP